MTTNSRFQTPARLVVAALAIAGTALGIVATVPAADASGLRNCVEVPIAQAGRVGCYEMVWADGVQRRMTFSNTRFDGATPKDLDAFYVLAPQTANPQGYPPNTFPHDHVVRDVPAGNHGTYSVKLQGYFVLCSGQGITTGACVASWTNVGGPDALPFAQSVNGHSLTSTEAIESAAAAGLVSPINLGPGAVIVGSLGGD
jgi:hypothetical protein